MIGGLGVLQSLPRKLMRTQMVSLAMSGRGGGVRMRSQVVKFGYSIVRTLRHGETPVFLGCQFRSGPSGPCDVLNPAATDGLIATKPRQITVATGRDTPSPAPLPTSRQIHRCRSENTRVRRGPSPPCCTCLLYT